MATADRPTTITMRSSTWLLLASMKRPGESYNVLLQELAEEYYPPLLVAELKERVSEIRGGKGKGVPAKEVHRRWGVWGPSRSNSTPGRYGTVLAFC